MKFKFDKDLGRIKRARKVKQVEVVKDKQVEVVHDTVGREQSQAIEEANQGQISLGGDEGSYSGELEEY